MGRIFRRLLWLVTLGRYNPDPNAPPDYTKDKLKIESAHKDYDAALKKVRTDKTTFEGELAKLEGEVEKSGAAKAETAATAATPSIRTALFDIKLKRKELALLNAREVALCAKIERAKILLGMIALYEDSKPMEIGDSIRHISDRINVRIDNINVDLDEAKVGAGDVSEHITVSDHDEELDKIEAELVERARAKLTPKNEEKATTAELADETADAGEKRRDIVPGELQRYAAPDGPPAKEKRRLAETQDGFEADSG